MRIAVFTIGSGFHHPESEDECFDLATNLLNSTGPIAVDVETISLRDRIPIGISIAPARDIAFYYPIQPDLSPYIPWDLLRDKTRLKVIHNSLFDLDVMGGAISPHNVFDTCLIASYYGLPLQLKDLAYGAGFNDLDFPQLMSMGEVLKEHRVKETTDLPADILVKKCCLDDMATYAIWEVMKDRIDHDYYSYDAKLLPIMLKMSHRGVKVDQDKLLELESRYLSEVQFYEDVCQSWGFNPASSKQVGYVLADRGNILPFTRKYNIQVNEEVLRACEDPLAAVVLNYRKAKKVLSNVIQPLKGEERAYTKYGLISETGRTTSSAAQQPAHINMQNLFKRDERVEVRNIFMPDNGVFTDWDDSQIELRVLAYLSQDNTMQTIFSDPNGDIHGDMAAAMGVPRSVVKNMNFGIIYGASDERLALTGQIPIELASTFRHKWAELCPQAWQWVEEQKLRAVQDGYVESLYGRRYYIGSVQDLEELGRKAVNYPIQGTASEIFKKQLLLISELWADQMAIEVHDEAVLDGYIDLSIIQPELEHIAPFHTPITVKYVSRWE